VGPGYGRFALSGAGVKTLRRLAVGFVALALAATPTLVEAHAGLACENSAMKVGPCQWFRGRLNVWNGAPPLLRIWKVGTHRIVGVVGPKGFEDPDDLLDSLQTYGDGKLVDHSLFGEFRLCPLTRRPPHHQEDVCIAKARKLTFVEGKP